MENLYLAAVVRELTDEILGRAVARISLAESALLFDLRLARDRVLRVSLDRSSPAFYLSQADRDQFNAGARANDAFISLLRKHIVGAKLISLTKDPFDRIIRLRFESFDAGGDRRQNGVVLSLTGRSADAWLVDSTDAVIGSFSDSSHAPPLVQKESADFETAMRDLSESVSSEQMMETFFGVGSPFGPLLKREFIARSRDRGAVKALKSLLVDLYEREPTPLIYSRLPLDQIGSRLINLKTDLVLTQIELVYTDGMLRRSFTSLSEAADQYYRARSRALELQAQYNSASQLLVHEIKKRESAMRAIEADQIRFDDPDRLKRFGDLILANLSTAQVEGSRVSVVDYFDELQPTIQIELPENKTLQQAAVEYFSRYQKARRALTAIDKRRREIAKQLDPLRDLLRGLEQDPTADRIRETRDGLDRVLGRATNRKEGKQTSRSKAKLGKPGRRFVSSDGFEVLVGRNDRDNDELTFRVARSQDVWMHAADYPGSHVLVSNPSRNPVPQRTITEAAELAAFYSQAKREGKAAVHYTQRKSVSKPPRAKPGLVRLSSFKTILVEPRCALKRIE
ncbi:MAG TPA: NFACT family protein [Blastocatellia bacterium]|nr:NFACT family protein [Blastocatellia bacterium]